MEIYLIRHTTPLITKGLIYGQMDVKLADTFLEEKEIICKQLPISLNAIYSSPSSRCSQLASRIALTYPEIIYKEDKALYELNFGDWEGQTWDTVNRNDSEIWMNDFVNLSPPNGETMLQMQSRVLTFWAALLLQPHEKVAVITHGGVIRILLAHQRSIALKDAFSINVNMGEVVKLLI